MKAGQPAAGQMTQQSRQRNGQPCHRRAMHQAARKEKMLVRKINNRDAW
jgi:hypothetical protein